MVVSWQAAQDNVGVARYVLSRSANPGAFVKVAESATTEYIDRPPTADSYSYRVLAVDFEDNISMWSEPQSMRIERGFPAPQLSVLEQDRLNYAEHIRTIHAAGEGRVAKGVAFQFGDSLTGALNYQLFTEAALGRYMVEARAREGWKTTQARATIAADLQQVNPEFCLILLGTNNGKSWWAIRDAMEDLMAIVKACEDNGTVPIVATIPPRGFTDPKSRPEADYNSALIETCRKNKVPVAYLFEELQEQPDRRALLAGDGIHWGTGGFPIAALAWKKAMQQVLFALLDRSV
jgi:hypothetical protein